MRCHDDNHDHYDNGHIDYINRDGIHYTKPSYFCSNAPGQC